MTKFEQRNCSLQTDWFFTVHYLSWTVWDVHQKKERTSDVKYGFCKNSLTKCNYPDWGQDNCIVLRVSVQGVKSLGGHYACLCRGFEFYELKK